MAWRLLVRRAGRLTASFSPANGNTCKNSVAASLLPQQGSFSLPCEGAVVVFTATFSAVAPEEYAKRNYANNISEYNTVLGSLTAQRRHFLLRDVYDDMLLDGVQPIRDTFHTLIVGAMKGARLQDAIYFMDEMKSMGLVPDTTIYNFIISTCGKSKNSDCAIQVLEEMKRHGVKPRGQTYIALLCACASCGRVDRAEFVVPSLALGEIELLASISQILYWISILNFWNSISRLHFSLFYIILYLASLGLWSYMKFFCKVFDKRPELL